MQTFEQLTKDLLDFQRYEKNDFLDRCVQELSVRIASGPERRRICLDDLTGVSKTPTVNPSKLPKSVEKGHGRERH